jgi:hypothetical protein
MTKEVFNQIAAGLKEAILFARKNKIRCSKCKQYFSKDEYVEALLNCPKNWNCGLNQSTTKK